MDVSAACLVRACSPPGVSVWGSYADDPLVLAPRPQSGSKYETALASSHRSSTFSVILPSRDHSHSPVPPKPDPLTFKIPSLAASLPPLFLAPPFTPSHPVFHSLSRHAIKASDELRKQAEQEIEAFIKKKLVDLGEVEEQFKADTELLWKQWRDAWNEKVEKVEEAPETRRKASGNVPRVSEFGLEESPSPASPPVQQPLGSPRPHLTSVSLLSASLAHSSLHAHMGQASPAGASPSAVAGSEVLDGLSPPKVEDSIIDGPFRRVADDSFAIAASFKIGMEEENVLAARQQEYLQRRQERQAALERAAKEKAKEEEEEGDLDRGRSSANARRVQFADGTKEDDEGAGPEDSGERESLFLSTSLHGKI